MPAVPHALPERTCSPRAAYPPSVSCKVGTPWTPNIKAPTPRCVALRLVLLRLVLYVTRRWIRVDASRASTVTVQVTVTGPCRGRVGAGMRALWALWRVVVAVLWCRYVCHECKGGPRCAMQPATSDSRFLLRLVSALCCRKVRRLRRRTRSSA